MQNKLGENECDWDSKRRRLQKNVRLAFNLVRFASIYGKYIFSYHIKCISQEAW